MKNKILFSVGNLYKLNSSLYKNIEESCKLDVDGIEILFATVPDLKNFKLKQL